MALGKPLPPIPFCLIYCIAVSSSTPTKLLMDCLRLTLIVSVLRPVG